MKHVQRIVCGCFGQKEEPQMVVSLNLHGEATGEVPSAIFNHERTLEELILDSNQITELHPTLFQMEELKHLSLDNNEIRKIPQSIQRLRNLENFSIQRNNLNFLGIPQSLSNCKKLRVLNLSTNALTKVPTPVICMPQLRELYLNNCDIEFIPANFARLTHLTALELRGNQLSELPKSLKFLIHLKRLDISNNLFAALPEVIEDLTTLQELLINQNSITRLTSAIGRLCRLTYLDASNNRLKTMTDLIGNCTKLGLLCLTMNDLERLPASIGKLINLKVLKVDFNNLKALTDEIGKLYNLEELDVQQNILDRIPTSIGTLRKLTVLTAAYNKFRTVPSEIGSCTAMTILNLHYNSLQRLPDEIGRLKNLTTLNLIGNRLIHLPLTILNVDVLKALWLSPSQSKPWIQLQRERLDNGKTILTCIYFPQTSMAIDYNDEGKTRLSSSSGRRIGFVEPNDGEECPSKFFRVPTPHPKNFVKEDNDLEEEPSTSTNGESPTAGDVRVSQQASIVEVHEVKKKYQDIESVKTAKTTKVENGDERNDSTDRDSSDDNSGEGCVMIHARRDYEDETPSTSRPANPPPYHLAAQYSKTRHLFNLHKPAKFTQDTPANIPVPQPQHPRRANYYNEVMPLPMSLIDSRILATTAVLLVSNLAPCGAIINAFEGLQRHSPSAFKYNVEHMDSICNADDYENFTKKKLVLIARSLILSSHQFKDPSAAQADIERIHRKLCCNLPTSPDRLFDKLFAQSTLGTFECLALGLVFPPDSAKDAVKKSGYVFTSIMRVNAHYFTQLFSMRNRLDILDAGIDLMDCLPDVHSERDAMIRERRTRESEKLERMRRHLVCKGMSMCTDQADNLRAGEQVRPKRIQVDVNCLSHQMGFTVKHVDGKLQVDVVEQRGNANKLLWQDILLRLDGTDLTLKNNYDLFTTIVGLKIPVDTVTVLRK